MAMISPNCACLVHAQYDDDTVSPFPLHELLLLGKAVTA